LPLHVQSVNHEPLIRALDVVGMTVGDMDRSVGFSKLLFSKKVSYVEVTAASMNNSKSEIRERVSAFIALC